MQKPTLVVESITKRFGGRTVIDKLDLSTEPGEVLGLIGPTGAGKSTLIRIIGGVVMPDEGDIYVNGISLYRDYERCMRNTGIVPDKPAFYKYMTGRANLRVFASMYRGITNDIVDAVIERLNLGHCIDTCVRTWPSGDLKRLAMAAAIVHSPSLVIMDEALSGLDPVGVVDTRRLLRRLAREYGISVMITAHHMNELERMCDRVAIMDEGQIIGVGSVEKLKKANCSKNRHRMLLDRPDEAAMYINETMGVGVDVRGDILIVEADQSMVPRVISVLHSRGFLVYEVAPVETTLEEAYYYMLRSRNAQQKNAGGGY